MKALVFHAPKHVSVDTVDDPKIEDARDAVLRVTTTAICGSDLHMHVFIDELMEMIVSGKLEANDIISHRLPLAKAPDGYGIFNKKQENCTKVVLKPWD